MAFSPPADSNHEKLKALVVDDEKNIRTTLSLCLEQMGCNVTAAPSAESALVTLTRQPYDLAFLDLRLADTSGLDLVPKLLAEDPNFSGERDRPVRCDRRADLHAALLLGAPGRDPRARARRHVYALHPVKHAGGAAPGVRDRRYRGGGD